MTAPESRYFSMWGPWDGPVWFQDAPQCLGVVAEPSDSTPIGRAGLITWLDTKDGAIAVYQLRIHGVKQLPGWWVCRGRQFFRI